MHVRRPLRQVVLGLLLLGIFSLSLRADASPLALRRALQGAVRIEGHLQVLAPDGRILASAGWSGSGWTAACQAHGGGYRVRVRTANHVVDAEEVLGQLLKEEGLAGRTGLRVRVRYEVRYLDHRTYEATQADVVPEFEDSASLYFQSEVPRQVLPAGDPAAVQDGDELWVVGCPGGLLFVVTEGVLAAPADRLGLEGLLPSCWLATVPVAPGSSGAPVLNARGEVTAQVIAVLSFRFAEFAVLQPLEPGFAQPAAGGGLP
jgi:S1-C subfamily serine protease